MARRNRAPEGDDRERRAGSTPAGDGGGRVHVPVRFNEDGIDRAIDPTGHIYSGMTKRKARQEGGNFSKEEFANLEGE